MIWVAVARAAVDPARGRPHLTPSLHAGSCAQRAAALAVENAALSDFGDERRYSWRRRQALNGILARSNDELSSDAEGAPDSLKICQGCDLKFAIPILALIRPS